MLNMSIYSLLLASHISHSPVLSLSRPSSLLLQSSKFLNIFSPIIQSSIQQHIYIQHFEVKHSLSSIILLNSFACSQTSIRNYNYSDTLINTCLYIHGGALSQCDPNNNAPITCINTDIHLQNFTFKKTSGKESGCISLRNGWFNLTQCNAFDCYSTESSNGAGFLYASQTYSSVIIRCVLKNCTSINSDSQVIFINDSIVKMSHVSIYDPTVELKSNGTLIKVFKTSSIEINYFNITVNRNVLQKEELFAISVEYADTLIISDGAFFNFPRSIIYIDESYAFLKSICFDHPLNESIVVTPEQMENYFITTDNILVGIECPLFAPTPPPLSNTDKTYGVITAIVFFIFFVGLFIVIIALIFCKIGSTDLPNYGELNEPETNSELSISTDVSD